MRRGDDEVDRLGRERRIAGAHQFFGRLAFARAFDDRLAAVGKGSTRSTRADFNVFSHRPSLHLSITQIKTGDMMRVTRRARTMLNIQIGRLTTLLLLIFIGLVSSLVNAPRSCTATTQDVTYEDELESGKTFYRQRRYEEALKSFKRANEMREK